MRGLLFLLALAASPALAQPVYPPVVSATVDTSNLATKAEVAAADSKATAAQTAANNSVKTVNGVSPTSGAVTLAIPTPSNVTPPSVADASTIGNMTTIYALANHTHASKARKGRVLVPVSGVFDVVFTTAMGSAPLCAVTAEATAGDTNVVNAQVDGVTATTGFRIRITRTAQSVVALLGLTVLSVPTQVATYAHYICIEP